MKQNYRSHKLMQLIGLPCLAILQINQLCASKKKSLKPKSNYTQAGRAEKSDRYIIIDENFNYDIKDPLDQDVINRDQVGNPLDIDGKSIKIGTRKAFANGSSRKDQPFTLDNQKFYLERRALQAKEKQSEKESSENRMTDLGIKLEDLLDTKNLSTENRRKLEEFQAKMDRFYNLLRIHHQSFVPESILEEFELELGSIERSINLPSVSGNSFHTSSVTWRNPLFYNHDLTVRRRDSAVSKEKLAKSLNDDRGEEAV